LGAELRIGRGPGKKALTPDCRNKLKKHLAFGLFKRISKDVGPSCPVTIARKKRITGRMEEVPRWKRLSDTGHTHTNHTCMAGWEADFHTSQSSAG
jgi:hypothetical protein